MEIATTRLSSRGQIVILAGIRSHLKEGDNYRVYMERVTR